MKRVLLSITGTVLGVMALLSFKSQTPALSSGSGLPSAALPGTAASSPSSGAPPDPSSTPSAPRPASSAFVGDAVNTQYGIVQVKVTVAAGKITDVGFVQLTAFDDRSQQINSDAAPILLQETLSAQNAKIDSVSGATYTSDGYIQSLQSALDKAGVH